ncbi:MAG: hypothetical protein IT175_12055 [Acidobacteria bacterium]|nr:hypothetical protein [Acidobacteriota bacterium]
MTTEGSDRIVAGAREDLERRMLTAARGSGEALRELVHDGSEDVLRALAANPALDEDDLLLLLARRDLPVDLLRQVATDVKRSGSYRVRLALLRNPAAPASATLRFVPQLHLFDLVAVALIPAIPREVKTAAEAAVLAQVKQVPLGARVSLARRTGSEAILIRLLVDHEARVVEAALANSRVTEATVARAIRDPMAPPHTVDLVARNSRWNVRRDIRIAIVRNRHTPTGRALQLVSTMTRDELRLLARDPAVPAQIRNYIVASGKG